MKKHERATPKPVQSVQEDPDSWTFRPDEDVVLAVDREQQKYPMMWRSRSQLLNHIIRVGLADSTAGVTEEVILVREMAQIQERIAALRRMAEAQRTQDPEQIAAAKAALRTTYYRTGGESR